MALHSSGRGSGAGHTCLFVLSLWYGAGGLDLGLTIAIPGYRTVNHLERVTFAPATLVARRDGGRRCGYLCHTLFSARNAHEHR